MRPLLWLTRGQVRPAADGLGRLPNCYDFNDTMYIPSLTYYYIMTLMSAGYNVDRKYLELKDIYLYILSSAYHKINL